MTIEKYIVFQLGTEEYAIPVEFVKSIEKIMQITKVPNTENYIKGVINLRGVVTPIIDLRLRLDLESEEITDQSRIIIVTINDYEVGLIVDSANDVLDFDLSTVEGNPEGYGSVEVDYIRGVTKLEDRFIILLQLEKVLEKEE